MRSLVAAILIMVGVLAQVASSRAQKDDRSIAEGILIVADVLAYDDVCKAKIGDIGGQDGSRVMQYARGLGFDIQNDK